MPVIGVRPQHPINDKVAPSDLFDLCAKSVFRDDVALQFRAVNLDIQRCRASVNTKDADAVPG
jgi:hypothetical protein